MKQQTPGFYTFIVIIASLMTLVSVTINMVLPAFQAIATDLQLPHPNHTQKMVSLLYLGIGISQLFYGPLSDSTGRKYAIRIGLMLFMLGCIISLAAPTFNILLAGQLIQGLGLGAPRVLSVSIVRDRFEGNLMARAISFIMVIYTLTPTLSPSLGKLVLAVTGWRFLFIVFILLTLVILFFFERKMPETLLPKHRKAFTIKHVYRASLEITKHIHSTGYIIILGLYSGIFITYLNLSQQIFEFQYQLGKLYPAFFALMALGIGLASFLNGKLVLRTGMKKLIDFSLGASFLTATLLLFGILVYSLAITLTACIIFLFIQLFCYAILIGNATAMALKPHGHIAGLGAAVVGALSTLLSVPLSLFIGSYYNHSIMPLIISYIVAGIISGGILMIIKLNTESKPSAQALNLEREYK